MVGFPSGNGNPKILRIAYRIPTLKAARAIIKPASVFKVSA
jgi:hypothetical protein